MKNIVTVSGLIDANSLGFCQCHEHLMLRKGMSYEINPALCIDDVKKSAEEVMSYKEKGGRTIIEAQPIGCGRMADELIQISKTTDIQIIASTGFHKLQFYKKNHWIHTISESDLAQMFIRELNCGMYLDGDNDLPKTQCSAQAGIIKAAYDQEELSPRYKTLFRAAVTAALETGRTISVHIEQKTDPIILLDYMVHCGMNPEKLIFCHMDRACPDLSVHKNVLSRGVYLEYDTIGRFKYHDDIQEINIFQKMLRYGFEDQLLFSLDTTRERLKSYNSDAVGLDYILNTFIPLLEENGISPEQIQKFSNKNCVSALT